MSTITIDPGSKVEALNAFGHWNIRIALSGVVDGHDFPVVWVCSEEEYAAADSEQRQPDGVPWPAEDVRSMA